MTLKPHATILLALATAALAQQPTIRNAKLETRAFSGTLSAEISRLGTGPYWIGYSEPTIPGHNGNMCMQDSNGNSGIAPGAPVRLEGAIALVVLIRVENGKPGQLRATSPDCLLDAGGLPFYWLTGVPEAESLSWLKSQVSGPHSDTAVMMISLHQGAAADKALDDLIAATEPVEVRKRAAFWLGSSRGAHGIATLKRMLAADPSSDVRDRVVFALSQSKDPAGIPLVIEAARTDKDPHIRGQALFWLAQKAATQVSKSAIQNSLASDPDSSVRERAVFALTQMKNGEGVPLLIDVARTNRDPAVRKKAMFWLGQSKDPRALDFFAQILKP